MALFSALAGCSRDQTPEPRPDAPPALLADAPFSGWKTPAAPPAGEAAYLRFCAGCHGDEGKGFGRYTPSSLEPRPAALNAAGGVLAGQTDAEIARSISQGRHAGDRSLCPPWGETLAPESIAAIVAHVRSLP